MKGLARRLAEDLRHAAVTFSHNEAAASITRPAAAGLAVTLLSCSQRALERGAARARERNVTKVKLKPDCTRYLVKVPELLK